MRPSCLRMDDAELAYSILSRIRSPYDTRSGYCVQGATGGLLGVELDSRPRVPERTPTACNEALWKLHSEPHTGPG